MSYPPPFYPTSSEGGQKDFRRMPSGPKTAGAVPASTFSFEQAASEKSRQPSSQTASPMQRHAAAASQQSMRPSSQPNFNYSAPASRQSFGYGTSGTPAQQREPLTQQQQQQQPPPLQKPPSRPPPPIRSTSQQGVPFSAPPSNQNFSLGTAVQSKAMPTQPYPRPSPPQAAAPALSAFSYTQATNNHGAQSSPHIAPRVTSVPPSPALSAKTSPPNEASPGPRTSTLSPSQLPIPSAQVNPSRPASFRVINLPKAGHLQFPNYEVILLIFDSPQAIDGFLNKDDAPPTWKALRPGQLVAACLSTYEKDHARHIPVFGVPDIEDPSLVNNIQDLVDKLMVKDESISRRCSIWQSGDYEVYCDTSELPGKAGFEQKANEFAELGDKIIHQFLYSWDKTPHLHASESRRMTFNERWTYASVDQGSSPLARPEWAREAQDDTLVPCLSIDWAVREKAASQRWPRIYSKTGHYIELPNKGSLIILNRHYPYFRLPGVQYLQLEPPSKVLNQFTVERHQVDGALDRGTSLLHQLEHFETHFKTAKQGFNLHPSLAQAVISHLASYVLETTAGHSRSKDEALQSVLTSIANVSRSAIQSSELCRYGSAPVIPTSDALSRLLYTSFRCLKETFSLSEQELKPFATAMFSAMTGDAVAAPRISTEVIECFLITSKLALDNAAPLCGKIIKREDSVEVFARGRASKQPAVDETSTKQASKEADKMDVDKKAEVAPKRKRMSHIDSDLSDSDFDFGPQDIAVSDDEQDLYVDDSEEETASMRDETPNASRKRSSEEPLAQIKTKQPKVDTDRSSSVTTWPMSGGSGHEVDGDLFKKLLQRIMGRDTDKKQGEHLDGCAGLFKTSVQHELIGAKALSSQDAMKTCKKIIQENELGSEARCSLLMTAVDGVCKVAEKQANSGEWDWILLTLAHQASRTVEELCKRAEDAYRVHFTSKNDHSPFRHELKKSKGSSRLSNALIDVLDEVRSYLDTDFAWRRGPSAYLKEDEIDHTIIANLIAQGKTAATHSGGIGASNIKHSSTPSSEASTSSTSQAKEALPTVYLTFINLATQKGKRTDRATARFRETVFDVLFQIYFTPLIQCLTSKTLEGDIDNNEKNKTWVMQRRFLRFRLQLIDKLVENCKIGTTIFAARACSDLVFAPARYLPLPKEKNGAGFYQAIKGYMFPRLWVKQGKYIMEAEATANWQGWEALYSSLRSVKDDIILLAKKKDPRQYLISTLE